MQAERNASPMARIIADNDSRNGTIAQRIMRSGDMRPDQDGLYRHSPEAGTKRCGGSMVICEHCGEPIGWASEEGDEASWRFIATPNHLLGKWPDKSICPGFVNEPDHTH